MDFKKLAFRFKQFGSFSLIWQYARLGLLPVIVKAFFGCLVRRQSFKAIYPQVLKLVEPILIERFQVIRFKIQANSLSHEHPRK